MISVGGGLLVRVARLKVFLSHRALTSLFSLSCLFAAIDSSFAEATDNKKYCAEAGRIVILLVDVTTPYDQTDRNSIVRMVDDILSSIGGGDKLLIRTIADSHTRSERLIERCIPHCAEAGTWGRLFNCSDGRIRTDFETVRAEVVNSLRQRLMKFEELPYSDIVRTIATVTREDLVEGRQVRMYVYSDLIENSDYLPSRYLFSFTLPRLIYGLQQLKQIANLKNAEVRVAGVGRAGTKDRRPLTIAELNKLNEFWKAYFRESGAKVITIAQDGAQTGK